MKYNKSIFIFTRDLRLEDNTGLIDALKNSYKVIPIFILNPLQINDSNKYKSNNSIQFMVESLLELDDNLKNKGSKLFIFNDEPHNIINKVLKSHDDIEAVYMNMDYTPFARKRMKQIKEICDNHNIKFIEKEDYMLTDVEAIMKENNEPYAKFTPYYHVAMKYKFRSVSKNLYKNYVSKSSKLDGLIDIKKLHNLYDENPNIIVHGGRSNALKILKTIKKFRNYEKTRDYPAMETTLLSPYLKFNVVSIREVFNIIKSHFGLKSTLMKQLFWRDFYMMIIYNYPWVIGSPMKKDWNIDWEYDAKHFNAWKNGKTGIPIIDAGMRQLNTTGWMHNRLRMIVANFMIKILHINWMQGERYFAQKLIDYDPANNNGGWQWSASTGTDSQPYFRIFNCWLQSETYDHDAEYIKKWIPELKDVDPKDIHKWNEKYIDYPHIQYPKPIIMDMKKQINKTIKLYKKRHP